MAKKRSEDALDQIVVRDEWLASYYVFEEDTPVSVDGLHKTKFGLWKEISASNGKAEQGNDLYAEGRSMTCAHCNTSYNTLLKNPKCPYCHREP